MSLKYCIQWRSNMPHKIRSRGEEYIIDTFSDFTIEKEGGRTIHLSQTAQVYQVTKFVWCDYANNKRMLFFAYWRGEL